MYNHNYTQVFGFIPPNWIEFQRWWDIRWQGVMAEDDLPAIKEPMFFMVIGSKRKLVRFQDMPDDIRDLLHPKHGGKYVSTCKKVHSYIKSLPDVEMESPNPNNTYYVSFS